MSLQPRHLAAEPQWWDLVVELLQPRHLVAEPQWRDLVVEILQPRQDHLEEEMVNGCGWSRAPPVPDPQPHRHHRHHHRNRLFVTPTSRG